MNRNLLIALLLAVLAVGGGIWLYSSKNQPDQITDFDTMAVKVFFANSLLDPKVLDCKKVFPAERTIPKTQAVGRAALEELLKGPTDAEKKLGYGTNINPGVKIQKLTIQEGAALADFDKQLEFQAGGSCRVMAIRAQIEETLKQFTTVVEVVISIDGKTKDILQP